MIDNKKEYILCSAIWFKDNIKYNHMPKNIDIGFVLCGFRHCNIFSQVGGLVRDRKVKGIVEEVQGFLTSEDRFVGREDAAKIAIANNQFANDKEMSEVQKSIFLYSENIY